MARNHTTLPAIFRGLSVLGAGLVLAAASVAYERVGPAPAGWDQELCAPAPLHPCPEGVLQGGWPLGFLLDQPGVSVMGRLVLVEDEFRPAAFALDVVADAIVLWAFMTLAAELAVAARTAAARRAAARRSA